AHRASNIAASRRLPSYGYRNDALRAKAAACESIMRRITGRRVRGWLTLRAKWCRALLGAAGFGHTELARRAVRWIPIHRDPLQAYSETMSHAHADTPRPHRLTVADYYRMAEVGILAPDARVELIDGEIIDMATPGSLHAAVVTLLTHAFVEAVRNRALVR